MIRLKEGIQIKISTKQEGIYRGKSSIFRRGAHIKPIYIIGKALGIFLDSVYFGFFGNLFRFFEHRQNLTKILWENKG